MKESKKQRVVATLLIITFILFGICLVIDIFLATQLKGSENCVYNILRDAIAMGIVFFFYIRLRTSKNKR